MHVACRHQLNVARVARHSLEEARTVNKSNKSLRNVNNETDANENYHQQVSGTFRLLDWTIKYSTHACSAIHKTMEKAHKAFILCCLSSSPLTPIKICSQKPFFLVINHSFLLPTSRLTIYWQKSCVFCFPVKFVLTECCSIIDRFATHKINVKLQLNWNFRSKQQTWAELEPTRFYLSCSHVNTMQFICEGFNLLRRAWNFYSA